MTEIAFQHIADGEVVGDLYRHPDILNAGDVSYVIHIIEDPRGPARVHDRSRVCEVARTSVASHPYWLSAMPRWPAAARPSLIPDAVRAEPPKGRGAGGEKTLSAVTAHCATLAQSANPSGVLHSAALRCGRDSE